MLPSEGSVLARERGRATRIKERKSDKREAIAVGEVRSVVQVWGGTCRVSWRRKRSEKRRRRGRRKWGMKVIAE